ncbi:MAG TPA: DNA-directed RNA polymerase subunit beta [Planctomycetes bacterium]|nr:DNA-directed RNA polymerase subunit beta [Planctomycetota bacterium]
MARAAFPTEIRNYGRHRTVLDVPNLIALQLDAYEQFLQPNVAPADRAAHGLEAIIREVFPIESYDKTLSLEYLGYELGRPRYTPSECRNLRLTYSMPFKIRCRLNKAEPVEEDVYLGEIPIMVGGGEFIVNGAERVIVSQLHRSPGVDFSVDVQANEKKLHSCWIIPERGSWIEISVSKKDVLQVKIDQSGKFLATTLLRAMDSRYSSDEDIIRLFHETKKYTVNTRNLPKLKDKHVVGDIVDSETGEVLMSSGEQLTEEYLKILQASKMKSVEVIEKVSDFLVLNTLREDNVKTHEDALLKIYSRFRPGNPPQIEKAKDLFNEKFRDPARYRLGKVGRFRLNRKFKQDVPEDCMTPQVEDLISAMKYILDLRAGKGQVDDIDHLGNRRVRTIAELAADEFRKGFLKLRKTAQERMNIEKENVTPRTLINAKTISSSIDYFFGRGELSQVVDQTNPLSQLTHERRLSALGPGGLNRKRAGFEVRDVHISHYGRICPIETPEGTNIGLIASVGLFADVDEYGFLITPYRVVEKRKVTDEVKWLRADEESESVIVPADTALDRNRRVPAGRALARAWGDMKWVDAKEVQYMDVSPMQIVGVSSSLIPFLEHDDANRALMGSNMQRQAVPLVVTEPPLIATGMEKEVAKNSGMVVRARHAGVVKKVTSVEIEVGDDLYPLRKFVGLNERTCLNQTPTVRLGDKVEEGQIIADGAATHNGELALGRNVFVGFMTWDGYNFEDAVLVSEKLVKEDVFTSIHIDEFEIEIRETKLGREEFTRDIPNVPERMLKNLDESGIVRIGTHVRPGDILVGKVAPKSKNELSPEEKLLHAIFGRAGEDVKNDSLEVSPGVEGVVIDAQKFSRKVNMTEEERQKNLAEIKKAETRFLERYRESLKQLIDRLVEIGKGDLIDPNTKEKVTAEAAENYYLCKLVREQILAAVDATFTKGKKRESALHAIKTYFERIDSFESEKTKLVNRLSRGDELPTGVLEMVKVFIATKRRLSVGDKIAGRHGNKGVIARILPEEDMPFLADGTPLDVCLNPLGVPSRMNVGQILETHLGWAAMVSNFQAVTPVFDGATEADIEDALEKAGLPKEGKVQLFDGRTGEPFEQKTTVGCMYILKLHHLVDEKIHARATGPYSLITQQPLGGKARFGGQRFGEMEVWALEAYGAAYVLQELLTVKSDDVDGRTKIYESMVKGENTLEAGTPVSFDVLCHELRGLCLNVELRRSSTEETAVLGL